MPITIKQAEQIGRIEAGLSEVKSSTTIMQAEIKVMSETLAVNTKQLELHIEGVKLAREQNDILRTEMERRFKPIDRYIDRIKFLGAIAALVFTPEAIYHIVSLFHMLKSNH